MGTISEDALFVVLEVVGTIAFATSRVIAAARAGMDWLAGMMLAVVVAIGGGTMRGVLLGNLPILDGVGVAGVARDGVGAGPSSFLWQS